MPVKKTQLTASEPVQLTVAHAEADEKLRARIQKGNDLRVRPIGTPDLLDQSRNDYHKWDDYNYELLGRIFTDSSVAAEYRGASFGGYTSDYFEEAVERHRDDVAYKIQRLESIVERLELFPSMQGKSKVPLSGRNTDQARKVFIVHGHDDRSREAVARFVERLGLDAVILHEQPNAGRTILEKFEAHANVGFAVVLLTPDDVGAARSKADTLSARARQNVILELGFFFGRLGRDRVCALYAEGVELPSDIQGLVYIPLDPNDGWHLRLAKEFRQAGMPVDMNRI